MVQHSEGFNWLLEADLQTSALVGTAVRIDRLNADAGDAHVLLSWFEARVLALNEGHAASSHVGSDALGTHAHVSL
jgi:hypothetical protein